MTLDDIKDFFVNKKDKEIEIVNLEEKIESIRNSILESELYKKANRFLPQYHVTDVYLDNTGKEITIAGQETWRGETDYGDITLSLKQFLKFDSIQKYEDYKKGLVDKLKIRKNKINKKKAEERQYQEYLKLKEKYEKQI